MEELLKKRNQVLTELRDTEQKIGKAIETSALYTSLMDHCVKRTTDVHAQTYCKKEVMIKILNLLEVFKD